MSRRRRREREPGRVRKTVEVLVSGLFGVAVVGVVVLILQHGSTPAPDPAPSATVTGQAFPTGGAEGGLGIRSADTGAVTTPGAVRSAAPGAIPSTASGAEGATEAQQTGRTVPASTATAGSASGGSQSTPTAGSSTADATGTSAATASASPSASSTSGSGLLGVVGGLVGGVLGLL